MKLRILWKKVTIVFTWIILTHFFEVAGRKKGFRKNWTTTLFSPHFFFEKTDLESRYGFGAREKSESLAYVLIHS